MLNIKKNISEKGIYPEFFGSDDAGFSFFCQSHKCYNPTVEPLFPGAGRYVVVVVGVRVFVGKMVVPEFFIMVGTVVSAVPLSGVPPSLVAIIG